jgi:hypothetical protein
MMGGGYTDWGMLVGEVVRNDTMDTVHVVGFCIRGMWMRCQGGRWYVVVYSPLAFASVLLQDAWFNIPFHSFHTISIPFIARSQKSILVIATLRTHSLSPLSFYFQAMIVQIPRRKEDAKKKR